MYICHCHAVTTNQIKNAFKAGHTDALKIKACTKASENCGKCMQELNKLVKELESSERNLFKQWEKELSAS